MRERKRSSISFKNTSCRVKSEFAKESDPNYIMKRYRMTGQLPPVLLFNQKRAIFGDFSKFTDFTDVMYIVDTARESFNSLPSAIKARFGSDPAKFFEWYNDPANLEECVKLGLRDKSEIPVKDNVHTNVQETVADEPAEASLKAEQLA